MYIQQKGNCRARKSEMMFAAYLKNDRAITTKRVFYKKPQLPERLWEMATLRGRPNNWKKRAIFYYLWPKNDGYLTLIMTILGWDASRRQADKSSNSIKKKPLIFLKMHRRLLHPGEGRVL